jgi:hypothetical protein
MNTAAASNDAKPKSRRCAQLPPAGTIPKRPHPRPINRQLAAKISDGAHPPANKTWEPDIDLSTVWDTKYGYFDFPGQLWEPNLVTEVNLGTTFALAIVCVCNNDPNIVLGVPLSTLVYDDMISMDSVLLSPYVAVAMNSNEPFPANWDTLSTLTIQKNCGQIK